MAALQLTSAQATAVASLSTALEDAFLSGVMTGSTLVVPGLSRYDQIKAGDRPGVKSAFLSTIAAALTVQGLIDNSTVAGGEVVPVYAALDAATGAVVPTYNGAVRRGSFMATLPYTKFQIANMSVTLGLASLPARARVTSVVADVTTLFAPPTGSADVQLSVGYLGDNDAFIDEASVVAAKTLGLLDADLGTDFKRATVVQGGLIPSWTTAKQLNCTLTVLSGGLLSNLTQGSVTVYVNYETMGY